jgi:hypothetical protein
MIIRPQTTLSSILVDSLCAFFPIFVVTTFLNFCNSMVLAMLGRSLGFPGAQKANALGSFHFLQPYVFLLAVLIATIIASSAKIAQHMKNCSDQPDDNRSANRRPNRTNGEQGVDPNA